MAEEAKQAKPSYQDVLRQRVQEILGKLEKAADPEAKATVIFDALHDAAMESWKNGIEAGRRRAQGKASKPANKA